MLLKATPYTMTDMEKPSLVLESASDDFPQIRKCLLLTDFP